MDALLRGPRRDLGAVLERLGVKLFPNDRPLVQYVAWALNTELFERLNEKGRLSLGDVLKLTQLSERGADAILGVLCALGLVFRRKGTYTLTPAARDYFVKQSEFFIGHELRSFDEHIPSEYVVMRCRAAPRPTPDFGSVERLANQHARNLSACVTAVRIGDFVPVRRLIDLGGGSGAFAIPFALQYPAAEVVLVDLPVAIQNVPRFLNSYGLEGRVALLGMDVLDFPWKLPPCDAIFLGNLIHGFDDATCLRICQECSRSIEPNGRLFVHEMIWNANRDGPLVTALWNATMRRGAGKQRTRAELFELLSLAGFRRPKARRTSGGFWLITCRNLKRREGEVRGVRARKCKRLAVSGRQPLPLSEAPS